MQKSGEKRDFSFILDILLPLDYSFAVFIYW